MVQKSGVHQLIWRIYTVIYKGFNRSQVVGNGISEPSTVLYYLELLYPLPGGSVSKHPNNGWWLYDTLVKLARDLTRFPISLKR